MERCTLTELPPDQCACKNHRDNRDHIPELEAPIPTAWSNLGRPRPIIASKFPGKCATCSETISVGQLITPLSPSSKRWIHLECRDE